MTQPGTRDLTAEQVLRRLELRVTRRIDGLLHGDYLGLLPGPGSDFAEARVYRPGEDDVRRMDWNVTARTTVPHVRDLIADRELETWALVDASGSMDFGTAEIEKRELATSAVAAVGFLTAHGGNRLGAHVLHGGAVRRIPARSGRGALFSMVRALLELPRTTEGTVGPSGPTLADAIDGLRRTARRRGLAVLVSDFLDGMDDPDQPAWERPLRRLAARHQVLAIEVLDPRELELPDVGVLTLVDSETGRRREVSTSNRRTRDRYAEAAAAQRESIRMALRRAGAAHMQLRTDRDWLRDVVQFVVTQRRMSRAGGAKAPTGGSA
jgi:uncharacterized protein (DUF58 family)